MTHAVNNHVVTGDRDRRIDELENHAVTEDDAAELRMLREAREREEEFRAWQASHCGAARLGWDGQKR
ncbi:MAG TPA: hypothetical protein VLW50_30950 [Streptosporangiaceae bacterium]|nr:hypothetical protein [Streptosporangiaceae bacterium]